MKRHKVCMLEDAEEDLIRLHRYVSESDSPVKADRLLDALEKLCENLSHHPLRGHVPLELSRVGVTHYREVHFKPYRILYEAAGGKVFIHCILDGRRDMQDLLQERLLGEPSSP